MIHDLFSSQFMRATAGAARYTNSRTPRTPARHPLSTDESPNRSAPVSAETAIRPIGPRVVMLFQPTSRSEVADWGDTKVTLVSVLRRKFRRVHTPISLDCRIAVTLHSHEQDVGCQRKKLHLLSMSARRLRSALNRPGAI